ncbi:hypothetical protein QZH41_004873 [Actinostola sp. cb2023]|nr:hypothetical protein QZH41_004873 [Actinostola sp. cb2023]
MGRMQSQNNATRSYLIITRVLVQECNFANPDEHLIDALIFGTNSDQVRSKLLKDPADMTFNKAIDIARTEEATKRQVQDTKSQPEQKKGKPKGNAQATEKLLTEYSDCFEGIGCFEGEYHIILDETVPPVVHPPRRIPEALRKPFKAELDSLCAQEILKKVDKPTDWVNSFVCVTKPNGSIRLCLDPKDLNKATKRPHHYTPTLEDILAKLNGAKYFAIVDARSGYWNIKLDEESSYYTTFNSPFGRYRFCRLPFGLICAQDVFQKKVDETFGDLTGVTGIADDIVVVGFKEDGSDHDTNLQAVMERARSTGLKFNPDKCVIKSTSIPFYGHILSANGLKVDPSKTVELAENVRSSHNSPSSSAKVLGNKECPTCRKKLVSKRSLRPDPNFDALIAKIYPDREEYEAHQEKVLQRLNKHHNQQALTTSIEEGLKLQALNRAQRVRKRSSEDQGQVPSGSAPPPPPAAAEANTLVPSIRKKTKTASDESDASEMAVVVDMMMVMMMIIAAVVVDVMMVMMIIVAVVVDVMMVMMMIIVAVVVDVMMVMMIIVAVVMEIELVFKPHPKDHDPETVAQQTRYIKTTANASVAVIKKRLSQKRRQAERGRILAEDLQHDSLSIRKLSRFESAADHLHKYGGSIAAFVLILNSKVYLDPTLVKSALVYLTKKHEILRAKISRTKIRIQGKKKMEKEWKEMGNPDFAEFHLKLKAMTSGQWLSVFERELMKQFPEEGPLWRFVMLKEEFNPKDGTYRHSFVLSAHCLVCDSYSGFAFFDDFLDYLSLQIQDGQPHDLDVETVFPIGPSLPDLLKNHIQMSQPCHIIHICKDETTKLVKMCKANKCTVHGAFSAIATISMATILQKGGSSAPLTVMSSFHVDLRKDCKPIIDPGELGCYSIDCNIEIPYTCASLPMNTCSPQFWEFAQKCDIIVHRAIQNGEHLYDVKLMETLHINTTKNRGVLAKDKDAAGRSTSLFHNSILGKRSMVESSSELSVEGFYFASAEHNIGPVFSNNVTTVNGVLYWGFAYFTNVMTEAQALEDVASSRLAFVLPRVRQLLTMQRLEDILTFCSGFIEDLQGQSCSGLSEYAQEGHLDCLEWLAKRTATVHSEASIDGMTAAHAAAQEGHLECLAFLIQCAGCSGLARDKSGCTPMHFAAAGGHRSCVNWLALHGWGTGNERSKVGSSPLHVAAEHGHLEVVKLLMRSGAKADLYDRHGRTAYDIAVETGNEACAQFLLQATHKTLNGMVANIFVHQSSLKRVRFERKAIEKGIRDSNPNLSESQTLEAVNQSYYPPHPQDPQERLTRSTSLAYPSHYSYGDAKGLRTYSTNSLNNRVSLTNYLSNFDSSLTPALEGHPRNGYIRNASPVTRHHQPIHRTYSAPTPDVSSEPDEEESEKIAGVSRSQSMRRPVFSGRSIKINSSSSRNQYEVNPQTEAYNPKDLIPFPVESSELNIFRRLYRMSKRKLTRTTSLSINDEDFISQPKDTPDKFLVSGEDDFIPGSPQHYQAAEMTSEEEQQMINGYVCGMSPDGEPGNGREIVSYQRPLSTDFSLEHIRTKMRDNALIWEPNIIPTPYALPQETHQRDYIKPQK